MEIGFQQIAIGLLFIWFMFFAAGKLQQNRITKKLLNRIKTGIEEKLKENSDLSLDEFYAWVFSSWENLVKKNAWFVLNKRELWPIPANPNRIKSQMNLTPSWLGAYLKLHGFEIQMTETQAKNVNDIIDAIPPQKRQAIRNE